MLRSRSRWSGNYLRAGAGVEIIFSYMARAGAEEKKFRLRNTDLANLAVLLSKLPDLGNLAILTLLVD